MCKAGLGLGAVVFGALDAASLADWQLPLFGDAVATKAYGILAGAGSPVAIVCRWISPGSVLVHLIGNRDAPQLAKASALLHSTVKSGGFTIELFGQLLAATSWLPFKIALNSTATITTPTPTAIVNVSVTDATLQPGSVVTGSGSSTVLTGAATPTADVFNPFESSIGTTKPLPTVDATATAATTTTRIAAAAAGTLPTTGSDNAGDPLSLLPTTQSLPSVTASATATPYSTAAAPGSKTPGAMVSVNQTGGGDEALAAKTASKGSNALVIAVLVGVVIFVLLCGFVVSALKRRRRRMLGGEAPLPLKRSRNSHMLSIVANAGSSLGNLGNTGTEEVNEVAAAVTAEIGANEEVAADASTSHDIDDAAGYPTDKVASDVLQADEDAFGGGTVDQTAGANTVAATDVDATPEEQALNWLPSALADVEPGSRDSYNLALAQSLQDVEADADSERTVDVHDADLPVETPSVDVPTTEPDGRPVTFATFASTHGAAPDEASQSDLDGGYLGMVGTSSSDYDTDGGTEGVASGHEARSRNSHLLAMTAELGPGHGAHLPEADDDLGIPPDTVDHMPSHMDAEDELAGGYLAVDPETDGSGDEPPTPLTVEVPEAIGRRTTKRREAKKKKPNAKEVKPAPAKGRSRNSHLLAMTVELGPGHHVEGDEHDDDDELAGGYIGLMPDTDDSDEADNAQSDAHAAYVSHEHGLAHDGAIRNVVVMDFETGAHGMDSESALPIAADPAGLESVPRRRTKRREPKKAKKQRKAKKPSKETPVVKPKLRSRNSHLLAMCGEHSIERLGPDEAAEDGGVEQGVDETQFVLHEALHEAYGFGSAEKKTGETFEGFDLEIVEGTTATTESFEGFECAGDHRQHPWSVALLLASPLFHHPFRLERDNSSPCLRLPGFWAIQVRWEY